MARALYADIFFVGVLVDVVRDDDVPAVGIFLYEFCLAVMSHVHYGVTLRFDYVVDPADDIICIVGVNVVPCVYEMSSSRAEKINAFFQAADDVGLTLANSCSSEFTLKTMAYVSILVPFVIAYIFYAWRSIDRHKITEKEMDEGGHSY